MSFQIIVENHLIHIITKKGSAAFLALTASCKNWAMSSLASDVQQSYKVSAVKKRKIGRKQTIERRTENKTHTHTHTN